MNKRIVHDALILTAFTLVLGFILALVQGITAEPIDKANKAAAQKAYQAVFSDAKSFEKYDYDADEADKLVSDAGLISRNSHMFLDRCFCHCESIMSALEMIVT